MTMDLKAHLQGSIESSATPEQAEHPNTPWAAEPPALLRAPDLIARIKDAIVQGGYAGDTTPVMVCYMALTSRVLRRPCCVALVAPSSAGKNAAIDAACKLVPEGAYHEIAAGSPRALVYGEGDISHKIIVFGEADSIPDEGAAASAIRSLISDGELNYEVVEQKGKRWVTRQVHRHGPTGLITTSTESVAHQLGTRLLEVHIADTSEQTLEVIRAQARASAGKAAQFDPSEFVAAQEWLGAHGHRKVLIPFAEALPALVPVEQVRMRRDFPQLLTMISTSAVLHQAQRDCTSEGVIVASLDDYGHARELLAPVFESVVEDGLTPSIRQTVEAVKPAETVSLTDLKNRLGLSKSTTSERVKKAIQGGWLVNEETRPGHSFRLQRGEPLPDPQKALPSVRELEAYLASHADAHENAA